MFPKMEPGIVSDTTSWICGSCGMEVLSGIYHLCGGTPNYGTPDWVCTLCNCVVKYGLAHHCPGSTNAVPNPPVYVEYVDPVLTKLDRIIELLEAIKRNQ